jgi:hypothetical protein
VDDLRTINLERNRVSHLASRTNPVVL